MRDRLHDEVMIEHYRKDPEFAIGFLNYILENGDQAELMSVLGQMSVAFGSVDTVAKKANVDPAQLYKALSPAENPPFSSLNEIIRAMGLRLAVMPA